MLALSTNQSINSVYNFKGWGYGVYHHFKQYFNYISFIGGGNRRKPPTCRKSLTNFIT
jgi:hypothetical protein